jgi:hypothetical protein
MPENANDREEVTGPVVLKNCTCGYCETALSRDNRTTEHLVGRRFVPKGSLNGQWNLIFNACRPCNHAKSQLEDDISATSLQPDAIGRFHPLADSSHREEAQRKGARSHSRRTGSPIASSHERLTVTYNMGPATMSFSYIGPPQVDEDRIVALARFQVVGLYYWITYDEAQRRGDFIDGVFVSLRSVLRSDWGNAVQRAFMQKVLTWEERLIGRTGGGNFQVAIRKLKGVSCWSWALEWNRIFGRSVLQESRARYLVYFRSCRKSSSIPPSHLRAAPFAVAGESNHFLTVTTVCFRWRRKWELRHISRS